MVAQRIQVSQIILKCSAERKKNSREETIEFSKPLDERSLCHLNSPFYEDGIEKIHSIAYAIGFLSFVLNRLALQRQSIIGKSAIEMHLNETKCILYKFFSGICVT